MIFNPCDIYLPTHRDDLPRWAVIACDQYTSQRDYWNKVEAIADGAPSALHIIQPEIDLDKADGRLPSVHAKMDEYLADGTLEKAVSDGFVLTLRETSSGTRVGLIGAVDLESYDYTPGTDLPVRASEKTIVERIPPRLKIRRGASLEATHVLMLVNDESKLLIEPLAAKKDSFKKLYDFDLMLNGGHIEGYAIEDEETLTGIQKALLTLYGMNDGFLFAVGDGNHSLATAKAYWDEVKQGLSEDELYTHPARKALVEVVNLFDESLTFKPIHRVLFGTKDLSAAMDSYGKYLSDKGFALERGGDKRFFTDGETRIPFTVKGAEGQLDTVLLEPWAQEYAKENGFTIDYIHGDDAVMSICRENGNAVGILLSDIDKGGLFPSIVSGGVLPRKSFSMGEADDKRFYTETRKIK